MPDPIPTPDDRRPNAALSRRQLIQSGFMIAAAGGTAFLAGCGSSGDGSASSASGASSSAAPSGTASGGASSASGSSSSGTGSAKDTLRIRTVLEVQTLDPAFLTGNVEDAILLCVAENLVTYHAGSSELVNELAESITSSDDGLEHTFKLKKGMQFQQGYGEVTADDVKFSFERIAGLTKPKISSTYSGDWAALKEVEVVDKYTGIIRLKEPFAPLFLTTLPGNAGIVISKKAYEKLGKKFATHPVGSGPYEFTSMQRNQQVTLTRFKDWANTSEKWAPKPQWKQIIFKMITDDHSANIAVETHEVDFGEISYSSVSRFKDDKQFAVTTQPTLDYAFVAMNVQDPALKDIRVRKAIRSALDIDSMIEAAFDGNTTRAYALISPDMPIGYWKDAPHRSPDVDAAKKLLKEAGVDKLSLKMGIRHGPGSETIAQIVQANLAKIGITVKITVYEGDQMHQAVKSLQLCYQSFSNQADPSWATVWFTTKQIGDWNFMSWSNKKFDDLHAKALKETDQDKRSQMYIEMQKLMDDDAICHWVMYRTRHYAHSPEMKPALITQRFGKYRAWAFTEK